jgi:hypothetical protein
MDVEIDDLKDKAFNMAKNAVCCMVVGCPVVDFAGPGRQVHRVMTGERGTTLNHKGIERSLFAGGLLEQDKNGMVAHSTKMPNL